MSLQWTFIATFLYTEIGFCILLMLPFISPTRWQKLFRSRLFGAFRSYANLYFNIFILVLLVLFVDAIRDVRRYSDAEVDVKINPQAEIMQQMKLFRAQRNFYIAGFTLFLFVVMRRLVTLISTEATLMADNEATKKQAESATAAAQALLEQNENKDQDNDKEVNASNEELEKAQHEVNQLKDDLKKSNVDLDVMKKQAESTNTEYDRLLAEHAALQAKCSKLEGEEGSKKSD